MLLSFKNGLMAGTALMCAFAPFLAFAETNLPEIGVEAAWTPLYPFSSNIDPWTQYSSSLTGGDAGEYLSSQVGIAGSRMGGHGIDPVIRGQQQTQLNIINDGAMIHGGCPSRMDPPTAYAPAENYDSIEVLKGYQSVRNGAGGSGGTVLFERKPVAFDQDSFDYRVKASGGFQSNGQARDIAMDAAAGNDEIQLRGLWSHFNSANYEDGNGNEVRSAATTTTYALLPVWTPTRDTTIQAGIEYTRMDDVLYATMMDAPFSAGVTQRFKFDHRIGSEYLKNLSFNMYQSRVDHVMDNYSLRTAAGMKMKTVSNSDTFGGQFSGDFELSQIPVTIGVDMQDNTRRARGFTGMAMETEAKTLASSSWPDPHLRQTGLFAEADPELSDVLRLRVGARYDRVEAEAKAANTLFGMVRANTLYLNHYGYIADKVHENNVGGLARLEYDFTPGITGFAGVSRSVRTADVTERYIAMNGMSASNRWVGNPEIDPEKHHQIDLGVTMTSSDWDHTISGYYDRVSDYIFRDRARGQDGILVSGGESIYRNIQATLMGMEYETSYRLTPSWTLGGAFAYTYGQNRTDDDALSQIPPLEGRLSVDYGRDIWSFGTVFNFALKQNRIDSDTAQRDVGKTPGYGTLDLYAKADLKPFEVRVGVSNVFDKAYSSHLNKANAFDPTEVQVNEPGRSVGIQINGRF
ncbi:MAG: TonB-dependent copper receptor [Pseudobdellovibrionaceae bacterium]|jgi:iron complex outermembrane receptor protein|nr:TonB-dependent copper receptor [Pseudobdellovibrionaceae bacterium]